MSAKKSYLADKFFVRHLSLESDDAQMLHLKYYKEYGLALEGLTRHHKIDPLQFNREVDDALPLDNILEPDPKLRELIKDIDRSKVKLWLLTNAYVNHAKRVVKLLQVDDLFDGVTYCDYGKMPLICKPSQEMYKQAEVDAGASGPDQCYFVGRLSVYFFFFFALQGQEKLTRDMVDDSHLNCKHAEVRGWTTVHLIEPGLPIPRIPACKYTVHRLEDLRVHFPYLFKSTSEPTSK